MTVFSAAGATQSPGGGQKLLELRNSNHGLGRGLAGSQRQRPENRGKPCSHSVILPCASAAKVAFFSLAVNFPAKNPLCVRIQFAGRFVMRHLQALTLDETAIMEEAWEIGRRVWSRIPQNGPPPLPRLQARTPFRRRRARLPTRSRLGRHPGKDSVFGGVLPIPRHARHPLQNHYNPGLRASNRDLLT